jgi:predicted outer membrane repeat protein
VLVSSGSLDVVGCVFENNVGPADEGSGGALRVIAGPGTVTNSTFIANTAYNGGAISVGTSGSLTLIGCYARANAAFGLYAGTVYVDGGTFVMLNSTVTESYAFAGGVGYLTESAIVNIEHSVFTNHRAGYGAGFAVYGSSLSMTDCINRDAEITGFMSYIFALEGGTVNALRCIFQDIRTPHIGPVYLRGSTGYFEDCDFIDNYVTESYGTGGITFLRPGSSA